MSDECKKLCLEVSPNGPTPLLTTGGPFAVDPTSFFGEFAPDGTALAGGTISLGTVTATTAGTSVGYVVDGTFNRDSWRPNSNRPGAIDLAVARQRLFGAWRFRSQASNCAPQLIF